MLSLLGKGAMGAVYLAEHDRIGRHDALKILNRDLADDESARARFTREARNASFINHPNVCTVYDFGETREGLPYIAMEYVEGETLTGVLEREGPLPPRRAAELIAQVTRALEAAHARDIVHRDLKPDNVMLARDARGSDVVKVVDFGIAKAMAAEDDDARQDITRQGLVVGTPQYVSPEQLEGKDLDGRSDLYSLGVVLFRVLTGRIPFGGETWQEVMTRRLSQDPLALADAAPEKVFPVELERMVARALRRHREDRYQDAVAFREDLLRAVGSGTAGPAGRGVAGSREAGTGSAPGGAGGGAGADGTAVTGAGAGGAAGGAAGEGELPPTAVGAKPRTASGAVSARARAVLDRAREMVAGLSRDGAPWRSLPWKTVAAAGGAAVAVVVVSLLVVELTGSGGGAAGEGAAGASEVAAAGGPGGEEGGDAAHADSGGVIGTGGDGVEGDTAAVGGDDARDDVERRDGDGGGAGGEPPPPPPEPDRLTPAEVEGALRRQFDALVLGPTPGSARLEAIEDTGRAVWGMRRVDDEQRAWAAHIIGVSRLERGDTTGAVPWLERAVRLDPDGQGYRGQLEAVTGGGG